VHRLRVFFGKRSVVSKGGDCSQIRKRSLPSARRGGTVRAVHYGTVYIWALRSGAGNAKWAAANGLHVFQQQFYRVSARVWRRWQGTISQLLGLGDFGGPTQTSIPVVVPAPCEDRLSRWQSSLLCPGSTRKLPLPETVPCAYSGRFTKGGPPFCERNGWSGSRVRHDWGRGPAQFAGNPLVRFGSGNGSSRKNVVGNSGKFQGKLKSNVTYTAAVRRHMTIHPISPLIVGGPPHQGAAPKPGLQTYRPGSTWAAYQKR